MLPAERRGAWAELVDWVVWLYDRYELSVEERLPACWAEHPGLIEELQALKTWRQEIYGPHTITHDDGDAATEATDEPDAGAASGQAARYWHSELRQVVHAATTFYAAGCRAGHRGAPVLASADAELHARWLSGDPLTGIPATLFAPAPRTGPPSPAGGSHAGRPAAGTAADEGMDGMPGSTDDWAPDEVIRDALHRGTAHPLGELVTDYILFDGSWWTPSPNPQPAQDEQQTSASTGWQRVRDVVFAAELDAAAARMRAADALVAERRRARDQTRRDQRGS